MSVIRECTGEQWADLLAAIERRDQKDAAEMPDDKTAIAVMHRAYDRLGKLGWRDACYCPKNGSPFEVIEAGSTGIHHAHYEGEWPNGHWWIHEDGDLWPSRPILFRLIPTTAPCDGGGEADETQGLSPQGDSAVGEAEAPSSLLSRLSAAEAERDEALAHLAIAQGPDPEEVFDEIGMAGRKTTLGKHKAANYAHIQKVIGDLDAAGMVEAADTLLWAHWWRQNERSWTKHLRQSCLDQQYAAEAARDEARDRVAELKKTVATVFLTVAGNCVTAGCRSDNDTFVVETLAKALGSEDLVALASPAPVEEKTP